MNAPLPRIAPPADTTAPAWQARLSLAFAQRGARTVLTRREHLGPLRLQKALYPEGEAICHGIVLHPPAGIAGGDQLHITAEVGPGAHALLTTPGAGKWYRSLGADGVLTQDLQVATGGVLEWLPQENIVFDRALARMNTRITLAPGATLIATDMTALGRHGGGERFDTGHLAQTLRIECDGRPLWLEQIRLNGSDPLLHAACGLAGRPVFGSLIAIGDGLDDALLAACRALPVTHGDGAITRLPDLLIARYVGERCEAGRAWFSQLWQLLRPALTGRDAQPPRIWNT